MKTLVSNKSLSFKLVVVSLLMFAFAIMVLPPLYRVFCEITGIGIQPIIKKEGIQAVSTVDTSRTIKIQFLATNAATMPWEFKPQLFEVEVHPGERKEIAYYAKNITNKQMVGQAVPHISPYNAVDHFIKTECFCFNQQTLKPGEEALLKLIFIVDRDLPKNVKRITLAYTLFDISNTTISFNDSTKKQLLEKNI